MSLPKCDITLVQFKYIHKNLITNSNSYISSAISALQASEKEKHIRMPLTHHAQT